MYRETLPLTALPAWSRLNDINFLDIKVQDLGGAKGHGLVTERSLNSQDTFDVPTLLEIPHALILSAEGIDEFRKVDHHFRQLLDAAGGETTRKDVMLFLLMQVTMASPAHGQNVGLSNPWTEYVKMLPKAIPLPTTWSTAELKMLAGTSLEMAVNAKLSSLLAEFEALQEKSSTIAWCYKCWWENEDLAFEDWILLDSLYRSRSLELPNAGEAMIPCIDMANHSAEPNAYYENVSNTGVALLLRPNMALDLGSEVTISYGASKSKAEMLFSYGFLAEESEIHRLTLAMEPFPDDPLGRAKIAAFAGRPVVFISSEKGTVEWKSPFLYLMCLNEEDGLDFKVLQQTDGTRTPLRVFWQGCDVTSDTEDFERLINDHALTDIFRLRVVALLQDRIRQQLESLYESEEVMEMSAITASVLESRRWLATELRESESSLLEAAFAKVQEEKDKLLESEVVLQYLGSMEVESQDTIQTNEETVMEEDIDFS